MMLHNVKYLKENRRALRSNLTPSEAELWKHLRSSQLEGYKFRRQHSIGNYILDFYCTSKKLAIELDGDIHFHYAAEQADLERDQILQDLGIKVLRFENKDVFENLEAVLQEISLNLSKEKLPALDKEGLGVVGPQWLQGKKDDRRSCRDAGSENYRRTSLVN